MRKQAVLEKQDQTEGQRSNSNKRGILPRSVHSGTSQHLGLFFYLYTQGDHLSREGLTHVRGSSGSLSLFYGLFQRKETFLPLPFSQVSRCCTLGEPVLKPQIVIVFLFPLVSVRSLTTDQIWVKICMLQCHQDFFSSKYQLFRTDYTNPFKLSPV